MKTVERQETDRTRENSQIWNGAPKKYQKNGTLYDEFTLSFLTKTLGNKTIEACNPSDKSSYKTIILLHQRGWGTALNQAHLSLFTHHVEREFFSLFKFNIPEEAI